MIIPPDHLQPQTLRQLIEELVTRDGTELTDADRKIDSILDRLRKGDLLLDFDADSISATLIQSPPRKSNRNAKPR